MSILSLLTTLSVLTLAINFASADHYTGTVGDRKVTASVKRTNSKKLSIDTQKVSVDDIDSSLDEPVHYCLTTVRKPLGTAVIDFGFEKFPATLTGIAYVQNEFKDACPEVKVEDLKELKFNVATDLDNKKAAVSFSDQAAHTINIYNHSLMDGGSDLSKIILDGASYSKKGSDSRETLDEDVNADLVLVRVKK